MTAFITTITLFITGRFSALARQDRQRGSLTLQEVLLTSFYVVAGAGVVAAIGAAILYYTGLITVGP